MGYQLDAFGVVGGAGLSRGLVEALIERHERVTLPRLLLLWTYYRNPMEASSARNRWTGAMEHRLRLGQERGLPGRISGSWVGRAGGKVDDRTWARKEVVIENDIAWRVHTMVDFMFGRAVTITSLAKEEATRRKIERALDAVWEGSGGIALLQDMGLMGHVYGHVDLVVRSHEGEDGTAGQARRGTEYGGGTEAVRIEVVEPTRGIALLDEQDYRKITAYIVRCERETSEVEAGATGWGRLASTILGREACDATRRTTIISTEIITGAWRQVYEQDGPDSPARLVEEGPVWNGQEDPTRSVGVPSVGAPNPSNPPVVHIQNISQPFAFEGMSEVEPLIPLQDELNTRLSDRASRVTLQSFKMYLVKGMEGVEAAQVGPGRVWFTDNPDAAVEAFGGDAASPSEDAHVEQVREALDKASGVPPLASGVVRAKIGNLSSENALRITLMGLLSKTARKRVTYGRGIAEASRLALEALDRAGVLKTDAADRGVRVDWPDPLPREEKDALDAAEKKVALGVSRERVLSELGYAPSDPGVV